MADGVQDLADGRLTNRQFAADAAIDRDKLARRPSSVAPVPPHKFRTWDALHTNLPATPASDDLGLVTGTWGTDAPYLGTGDLKAAGATTRRAAALVAVPYDFEPNATLSLRARAGMKTTVAGTSATVDVEAWKLDPDGTLGSADLVSTSAQSINSLTVAEKTFALDSSELEPGDVLYVRVSVTVTDGATGTAVIGAVTGFDVVCDMW